MKLRKIISTLLMLVILISSVPAFELTAEAAMPYRITVDLTNQIVTIYSNADDTIVRQMLCSTGLDGSTPRGTYTLPKKKKSDERSEWFYFSSFDCYAHYATRVFMGIMFHSIPYSTKRESSISKTALAEFGQPASHGCIRLRTEDAKFIALNCLPGTKCKIYRSNKTDEDLRALLYDSSYTSESGMSYKQFLGIPDEPGVLGRYSKGSAVEDIQYRLRALGFYTGKITGEYSGATVTAVKALQEVLGLEQNGAATQELQDLLYSSDAPTALNVTLKEGMSGPTVRNLQQYLQALRIYDDDIDGVYDVDVSGAVKLFQQAYSYTEDGVASPTIQKAIAYEANKLSVIFDGCNDYTCETLTEEVQLVSVASKVNIRIRSKPNTSSSALGKATDGTRLILTGVQGDWCQIRRGESIGYIMKKYLEKLGSSTTCLTYSSPDGGTVYTIGHTANEYYEGASFPAEAFADYLAGGGSTDEPVVDETEIESAVETASFATVCTDSDEIHLNLREDPSTSSSILAELANGTRLQVLLKSAEWTLVSHEGVNGYLMNSYLNFWEGPADALETGYVPEETAADEDVEGDAYEETIYAIVRSESGNANVYDIDSDDANRIGQLPVGTNVTVIRTDDDWSFIDYQGNQGYMKNDDLHFSMTGEEAEAEEVEEVIDDPNAMLVESPDGNAPVYGGALDSSGTIGDLPHGTVVSLVSVIGDWSLIDYQGYRGFMKNAALKAYASEEAVESTDARFAPQTGSAIVQSVSGKASVYEGFHEDTSAIGALSHGTAVTVVLNNGEWSLIDLQGNRGYMKNVNLQIGENASPSTFEIDVYAVVKSESGKAAVFDGGSNTANKIGELKADTEVGVIESDEHWSYIDYKGNQGYMRNINLYEKKTEE